MSSLSFDDLTQRLLSLDLIDLGKLRDVENSFGARPFTAEEFIQALQRRGYLTKYQVERLISGETTGYYYGDYRIQYLIGAGSFARVFRCVHKDTGQVVAVKVLRARFREDETAIKEFEREGELGMQMRHPNIAAIYELKSTKYEHYMVMEFVEGLTLREELKAQKNGRIAPLRATRIARDVCSALDYAQRRGYQHRDMKLSNIILSSSGKAVLLDFGLITDESSGFKTQRAIEYAALERSTHVPRDDKRSDLYFLGAVYYQLPSGIAPLGEIKERAKRLDAGRFRQVKPIREVAPFVPRCVAYVVDKAMKYDPNERYQSPGLMLEALDAAAQTLESGVDIEQEEKLIVAATKEKKEALTSVMIVEANSELQNAFRTSFKNAGYRALVMSNAERALERLDDGESMEVNVVLFNAQSLGPSAVEAFNKMLTMQATKTTPAILLLDENQVKWAAKAKRSKTRLAVGMPITMKRLLLVVDKLIKAKNQPVQKQEDAQPTAKASNQTSTIAPELVATSVDTFPTDAFADALESAYDRVVVQTPGETGKKDAATSKENLQELELDETGVEKDEDYYYYEDEEDEKKSEN